MRSPSRRAFVVDTVILLIGLALLFTAFRLLEPRYDVARYRAFGERRWETHSYPFYKNLPEGSYEVVYLMRLGSLRFSRFQIIPDNCIEAMKVNGKNLPKDFFPFCDYTFGEVLNLSPFLKRGRNILSFTVKSDGGIAKVHIFVANRDPLLLTLHGLLLFIVGVYLLRLARRVSGDRRERFLWVLFFGGVFLRVYYLFITLAGVREVDVNAHMDYIRYLLDHGFALPPSGGGWAFYHPPLYYYISASWIAVARRYFGGIEQVLTRDLQILSLFLSLGTFAIVFWMSFRLFPKRAQYIDRLLFLLFLAVQPGFVFFAARINNDVLYQFFAFAAFATLLAWWKHPRVRYWYLCIGMIILGLFTKSNMLLLLPVAYGCLLLKRGIRWKRKIIEGSVGMLLVVSIVGMFYVFRFVSERNDFAIQNLHEMTDAIIVDTSPYTLIEFNPLRLAKIPYNYVWEPDGGRDYFWEYWMRSAFFGRFDFGKVLSPLASTMLLLASLLISLLAVGFYKCIRSHWYETLPLLLCAGILLLGHVVYRQYAPYAPSQDFRYSVLTLVPLVFFLVVGLRSV